MISHIARYKLNLHRNRKMTYNTISYGEEPQSSPPPKYQKGILNVSIKVLCQACIKIQIYNFTIPAIGTSVRRSSRSAFRRLTGNDVSGHYKRHYFLSFFSFFFLFFSPSSTFLIEGVLGSKNLFCESCLKCPKTQGQTPFQTPSAILGPLAGGAALQAVRRCRR